MRTSVASGKQTSIHVHPRPTIAYMLEVAGVHMLFMSEMARDDKITLSFWNVDEVVVERRRGLYYVSGRSVGNIHGATAAYMEHIAPSFDRKQI